AVGRPGASGARAQRAAADRRRSVAVAAHVGARLFARHAPETRVLRGAPVGPARAADGRALHRTRPRRRHVGARPAPGLGRGRRHGSVHEPRSRTGRGALAQRGDSPRRRDCVSRHSRSRLRARRHRRRIRAAGPRRLREGDRMRLARVLVWEVRSLVRRVIPMTAFPPRLPITIFVVMVLATPVVAPAPAKGAHPPAPSIGMLAGFLAMSLGMATAASLAAGAALLLDAEHARLYQLAPASDLVRAFVPLGALGILGALASRVFAAPLMAGAIRSAPRAAIVILAAGVLAVAWSLLLTAGVLTVCARWLGRENGARAATLVSMTLTLAILWSFGVVVRLSTSAMAITFGLA